MEPVVGCKHIILCHVMLCQVSNYKRGHRVCVSFYRRSKLESDQFPHTSPSVNTSFKVSPILGYEGCLRSRFLNVFKSTGWHICNTSDLFYSCLSSYSIPFAETPRSLSLSVNCSPIELRCLGRFRSPSRSGPADTFYIGTLATFCRRSWAWISSV